MLVAACLFAALAVNPIPPATDWPEFRGPTGDGVAPAGCDPPVTWSETDNVRWKVPVRGRGWSSPIIADGRVWVTTATATGTELSALCFDRATGRTLHDLTLFSGLVQPDIRQFNTYATPTPALADGKLYAHFGSAGTACVEAATGKVVWTRTDLSSSQLRGAASSAVVFGGKVYLHFDGFDRQYAVALNATTGKTVWEQDRKLPYTGTDGDTRKAFATPTIVRVAGRPQLVSSAAVGTLGLDPDTGAELWRVVHGGMNEAARPVAAGGLVYLTTGHTQSLIAIRTGLTGDITRTGVAWTFAREAPSRPSPVVTGGHVYYVNDRGVAGCLDAATGAVKWQERLGEGCSAGPVLAAGRLYFVSERGKTAVIAASPAGCDVLATNTLAAGCHASPAVSGDCLFVRTETHLYCLGRK